MDFFNNAQPADLVIQKTEHQLKLSTLHKARYMKGDLLKKALFEKEIDLYQKARKGTYKQNIFTTQNKRSPPKVQIIINTVDLKCKRHLSIRNMVI